MTKKKGNVTPEKMSELFDQMKLCMARHIYKTKTAETLTPKSQKTQSKKKVFTWAAWFEQRFGENYYQFIERKKREKSNGKSKEEGS